MHTMRFVSDVLQLFDINIYIYILDRVTQSLEDSFGFIIKLQQDSIKFNGTPISF
jgi:hypothetical protein